MDEALTRCAIYYERIGERACERRCEAELDPPKSTLANMTAPALKLAAADCTTAAS